MHHNDSYPNVLQDYYGNAMLPPLTELNPFAAQLFVPSRYPMLRAYTGDTMMTSKKPLLYSTTFSVPVVPAPGLQPDTFMLVWAPHSNSPVVELWVNDPAGSGFHYLQAIMPSEDLRSNYDMLDLCSGIVQVRSNTTSGTAFNIQGVFNAVYFPRPPNPATLTFATMLSYAPSGFNAVAAVTVQDGVTVLAPMDDDNKVRFIEGNGQYHGEDVVLTQASAIVRNGTTGTVFTMFDTNNQGADVFTSGLPLHTQGSFEVSVVMQAEVDPRLGLGYQFQPIFYYVVDGANPNTWLPAPVTFGQSQQITCDATQGGTGHFFVATFNRVVYSAAPITRVYMTATIYASDGSIFDPVAVGLESFMTIKWFGQNDIGQYQPIHVIMGRSVGPGQSIEVNGLCNYAVVANPNLQVQVKPVAMTATELDTLSTESLVYMDQLAWVHATPAYDAYINGTRFPSNFSREATYESASKHMGSVFSALWRLAKPVLRAAVPRAAALAGGALGTYLGAPGVGAQTGRVLGEAAAKKFLSGSHAYQCGSKKREPQAAASEEESSQEEEPAQILGAAPFPVPDDFLTLRSLVELIASADVPLSDAQLLEEVAANHNKAQHAANGNASAAPPPGTRKKTLVMSSTETAEKAAQMSDADRVYAPMLRPESSQLPRPANPALSGQITSTPEFAIDGTSNGPRSYAPKQPASKPHFMSSSRPNAAAIAAQLLGGGVSAAIAAAPAIVPRTDYVIAESAGLLRFPSFIPERVAMRSGDPSKLDGIFRTIGTSAGVVAFPALVSAEEGQVAIFIAMATTKPVKAVGALRSYRPTSDEHIMLDSCFGFDEQDDGAFVVSVRVTRAYLDARERGLPLYISTNMPAPTGGGSWQAAAYAACTWMPVVSVVTGVIDGVTTGLLPKLLGCISQNLKLIILNPDSQEIEAVREQLRMHQWHVPDVTVLMSRYTFNDELIVGVCADTAAEYFLAEYFIGSVGKHAAKAGGGHSLAPEDYEGALQASEAAQAKHLREAESGVVEITVPNSSGVGAHMEERNWREQFPESSVGQSDELDDWIESREVDIEKMKMDPDTFRAYYKNHAYKKLMQVVNVVEIHFASRTGKNSSPGGQLVYEYPANLQTPAGASETEKTRYKNLRKKYREKVTSAAKTGSPISPGAEIPRGISQKSKAVNPALAAKLAAMKAARK